jgi:hypothetical protein
LHHSHQNSSATGLANYSALGPNQLNTIKTDKTAGGYANLTLTSVPSAQSNIQLSKGKHLKPSYFYSICTVEKGN